MFKEKFAKNLKSLRKARKLTQEQLADLVDVDFRYISLLENAKNFPSCELIERLSNALNIKYDDLFHFEEKVTRIELENNIAKAIKLLDDKNLKILLNIANELI